ncbi:MAG: hypothetical protein RL094_612 [Candidatus Parcubacteria bacterium]|jgi:PTH1 family peptidyl-tRNA hydrolase
MYYIVGLGNPGEEYADTRHNAGRIAVSAFIKKNGLPEVVSSKKFTALVSAGEIGSGKSAEKVTVIMPETFMNKSGSSLKDTITSVKKAEKLIVVHDDLDMPLGKIKIVFNRGSGGHKGIESINRAIKTEAYTRIKVGVSPTTPSGKIKKPTGEKVLDFIVGPFKKPEMDEMKKVAKEVADALTVIVTEDRAKAMEMYNQ